MLNSNSSTNQNRSQIDEIKEKLDIVSVVEKYLHTMKHSGPNYFALCPFHNEKTPSFTVNQDLQIYKCFGCGESGDVISFIQKVEGLEFPKALEKAANLAGVTLKQLRPDPARDKFMKEKQKLLEINALAAKYYNHVLLNHPSGKRGADYCERRKITKPIIKKFQIGYAPKSYDNLKNFLVKRGYEPADLLKWGLLVERDNRFKRGQKQLVDKFRDRLMFPIINHQGDYVGFSGRQVEKSDYGPKYLNSPETIVYKKKETLYGLFQAKDDIRKNNFVILVEGNVDILSSHRVGVENIVCPLGTALTPDQCKLIRRYTDKVYFRFDTDSAGEKALLRGLVLVEQAGLESFALDIGDYQDVDELIMAEEKKWKEVILNPQSIIEHLIARFAKKFDLKDPKGKSGFINEISPYIKAIQDDIVRKEYIKKVAVLCEVDETDVMAVVEKQTHVTGESMQVDSNHEFNENDQKPKPRKVRITKKEYLAAILVQYPLLKFKISDLEVIYQEWFITFLKELIEKNKKNPGKIKLHDVLSSLENEKSDFISKLALINIENTDTDILQKELNKLVKLSKAEILKKQVQQIEKKVRKAEITGEDIDELTQNLQGKIKKIRENS